MPGKTKLILKINQYLDHLQAEKLMEAVKLLSDAGVELECTVDAHSCTLGGLIVNIPSGVKIISELKL